MQPLDMQNMDLNTGYPINEYIELQTLYEPQYGVSITTSAFDNHQELFWIGTDDGRVSSYYGPSLAKYTSFKVPTDSTPDVKTIVPHRDNNIFVLTSECFSCYSRYGYNIFKHKEVSFQNLQCAFFNQQERFFLGGFSDLIYDFDIERLRVLRQLSVNDEQKDCILIKASATSPLSANNSRNGIVCTGSTNGQIIIRDACSLKSIHKFHPHNGSLSDFDVHGNYLASCGFTNIRGGNLCVDRFMMVYDLRMMRALNPVQLHIESAFLHYLPMCSSVVAVASQAGCFQLLDTNLMTPSAFYQAQMPLGLATTFSMSENSQAVAFGHSSGSVHLFTKGENIIFNDFSEETLFVDPPQVSSTYIDINNEIAPLSSIPVPLIENKQYISDWTISSQKPEYRPTPTINPEILNNSRVIHGIISVPNRVEMKRNKIFDEKYEENLKELKEKRLHETSISLDMMIQKPLETVEKNNSKEEMKEEKNDEKIEEIKQINEGEESNENKKNFEEKKLDKELVTNEKS